MHMRNTTILTIMKKTITAVLLTFVGVSSSAAEYKFTDSENQGFAKSCYKAAREWGSFNKAVSITDGLSEWADAPEISFDTYAYWEAEVKEITESGAHVENVIRASLFEKADNNGWSDTADIENYYYFNCVFHDVAKGETPDPQVVVMYSARDKEGLALVNFSLNNLHDWTRFANGGGDEHWNEWADSRSSEWYKHYYSRWSDYANAFKKRTDISNWGWVK